MNVYLVFVLLGLGSGALYAGLAQGIVLIYRSSGVVNFAQGALGMYAAYMFYELRTTGRVVVPPLPNPLALIEGAADLFGQQLGLPSWPAFVSTSGPMPTAAALVVTMGLSALVGLACHFLVFRPLRNAPELGRVAAAIGLMIVLQEIAVVRFGPDSRSTPPLLPDTPVEILGARVPVNRLILVGIVVALGVALTIIYRFTRFGLATVAAAENERGASFIGIRPSRLAAMNWVIASIIAAVLAVLFSTITALSPTNFSLLVVPALGAALLARFTSFQIATVAGLGIGILQSVAVQLQVDVSWLPRSGLPEAIPFLVIIAAVVIGGQNLPQRGRDMVKRLPRVETHRADLRWWVPVIGAVAVGAVVAPFDLRAALISTMIGAVVALSLVVLVGFVGQLSLMQMTLAALAAVLMTRTADQAGWPFPLGPLVAVVLASVIGVLIGLPALRVRGINLAIVTFGAAYTFDKLVLYNTDILASGDASDRVATPSLFGLDFGTNSSFVVDRGAPSPGFVIFGLAVTAAAALLVALLRRSDTGRQMIAVRTNERAAAAAGVDVAKVKIAAFALSAFLAALAGMLIAYRYERVNPLSFATTTSLFALAIAYLGGIGSISGAIVAGCLAAEALSAQLLDWAVEADRYQILLSGIGLILTAIANPEGIAPTVRRQFADVRARIRRARSAEQSIKRSPTVSNARMH